MTTKQNIVIHNNLISLIVLKCFSNDMVKINIDFGHHLLTLALC
jgi:hypothetical protein